MSENLTNLLETMQILRAARLKVASVDYAWNKLHNADQYLQKQVAEHFTK